MELTAGMDASPVITKRFKAMPGVVGYGGLIVVGVLSESYCGAAPLPFEAIGIGALSLAAFFIIGFGILPRLRRNTSATAIALYLFVPAAALLGMQARSARQPESIYRQTIGIKTPRGITNLHAKAAMGPMGGGAGLYFEADWSQQKRLAQQFNLVP